VPPSLGAPASPAVAPELDPVDPLLPVLLPLLLLDDPELPVVLLPPVELVPLDAVPPSPAVVPPLPLLLLEQAKAARAPSTVSDIARREDDRAPERAGLDMVATYHVPLFLGKTK
jgi:hypothetical protein